MAKKNNNKINNKIGCSTGWLTSSHLASQPKPQTLQLEGHQALSSVFILDMYLDYGYP